MELTLNEFVTAVVWASICLVTVFSSVSRFLHTGAERRLAGSRIICRLCGNAFVSPHAAKLTDCPSCGKPNLHRHNGKLG